LAGAAEPDRGRLEGNRHRGGRAPASLDRGDRRPAPAGRASARAGKPRRRRAPATDDPPVAESPLPPGGNGGDIQILWDNSNALGDWGLAEGDLLTGQNLETACLVSLFSDRLATPDFIPTDGTTDRRGWWADTYDQPLGSNLCQLDRAKGTRATLGLARSYALASLQWLLEDGVAAQVLCNTAWLSSTMLGIAIAIVKPNGSETRFMCGWAWSGLASLASPIVFPPDLAPQGRRRLAFR
jgi:phage gp46-like protein